MKTSLKRSISEYHKVNNFAKKVFNKIQKDKLIYAYSDYDGIEKIKKVENGYEFIIKEVSNFGMRFGDETRLVKFHAKSLHLNSISNIGYV